MIKLSSTPVEGTSVKLNLGFKDSVGVYYTPATLKYTFLAQNSDKQTWSVVDGIYQKEIPSASTVTITLDKVKSITGTTNLRKVMVTWSGFVDGQYSDFIDEVSFEIEPAPYITNVPKVDETTKLELKLSIIPQIGSVTSTLIKPVFICTANIPVNILELSAIIVKDTSEIVPEEETEEPEEIPCEVEIDATHTQLVVGCTKDLEGKTKYNLKISGLKPQIAVSATFDPVTYTFVTSDNTEKILEQKIDDEIVRATSAEETLQTSVETEITRATEAEEKVATDLSDFIANISTTMINFMNGYVWIGSQIDFDALVDKDFNSHIYIIIQDYDEE